MRWLALALVLAVSGCAGSTRQLESSTQDTAATPAPSGTLARTPTPPPVTSPSSKPSAAWRLAVSIVSLSGGANDGNSTNVTRGGDAIVQAFSDAGAACTIKVTDHAGKPLTDTALRSTQSVREDGDVLWEWTVNRSAAVGAATASITCSLNGQTRSDSRVFTIY